MAKRFGGQYSPGAPANSPGTTADTGYAQARRSPVGARVNLLFFWPVLLLAKSYFGPPHTVFDHACWGYDAGFGGLADARRRAGARRL